jgi:hypothetical protein
MDRPTRETNRNHGRNQLHSENQNSRRDALGERRSSVFTVSSDRGSGHDHSPFHLSVFDSGYESFKAALEDSRAGLQRMRIFSAATGSGETSAGMCYITGLIESADTFEAEYGHSPLP